MSSLNIHEQRYYYTFDNSLLFTETLERHKSFHAKS